MGGAAANLSAFGYDLSPDELMNVDQLLTRFERLGRVALTAADADFATSVSAVLEGIQKGYWGIDALHRVPHDRERAADMILITDVFPSGNRRLQELSCCASPECAHVLQPSVLAALP